MQENKKIPIGVKIISILYYLICALQLIFGITMIYMSNKAPEKIIKIFPIISTLVLVLGIGFIGAAVLSFFIARGLWKGQRWSRIIVIVFSAIGIIYSLVGFATNFIRGNKTGFIITLVFNLIIAAYLFFDPKVKSAFANAMPAKR